MYEKRSWLLLFMLCTMSIRGILRKAFVLLVNIIVLQMIYVLYCPVTPQMKHMRTAGDEQLTQDLLHIFRYRVS